MCAFVWTTSLFIVYIVLNIPAENHDVFVAIEMVKVWVDCLRFFDLHAKFCSSILFGIPKTYWTLNIDLVRKFRIHVFLDEIMWFFTKQDSLIYIIHFVVTNQIRLVCFWLKIHKKNANRLRKFYFNILKWQTIRGIDRL